MSENMINAMSLTELGYYIASRTGDMDAAAIARSSAPQVRYNAIVRARCVTWRETFSDEELRALVARVTEPGMQEKLLRKLNI